MNTTIEIRQLKIFVAVVRAGSFTKAARTLGSDKAWISRSLSGLERRLGSQLLRRSTRSLSLTEAGRDFHARAIGILEAIEDAESAVRKTQQVPTGRLYVSAGSDFGRLAVNEWIGGYLKKYPDMTVTARYTNRFVDIVYEGFDLAIRVGELPDSDLSARKLCDLTYGLFASPAYLAKRPAPRAIEDLEGHDLIAYAGEGQPFWPLRHRGKERALPILARLLTNSALATQDAAVGGLGIALLPTQQAQDGLRDERLVRVLPEWGRPPVPVHAVFAGSRFMAAKTRAFIEHVQEVSARIHRA